MRDMYTGIFYVNAPTIGAEVHLPFGGTKATGNGHREAGTAALDVFSEWKSIYVDFSGRLQRAQIDTVAALVRCGSWLGWRDCGLRTVDRGPKEKAGTKPAFSFARAGRNRPHMFRTGSER